MPRLWCNTADFHKKDSKTDFRNVWLHFLLISHSWHISVKIFWHIFGTAWISRNSCAAHPSLFSSWTARETWPRLTKGWEQQIISAGCGSKMMGISAKSKDLNVETRSCLARSRKKEEDWGSKNPVSHGSYQVAGGDPSTKRYPGNLHQNSTSAGSQPSSWLSQVTHGWQQSWSWSGSVAFSRSTESARGSSPRTGRIRGY